MRLRQAKSTDLSEIEACLNQALEFDPDNMEALKQAAHFYQHLKRDVEQARKYAALCRSRGVEIVREMEEILGQGGSQPKKKSASRHMGGIIGPY
jgi:hypothetical protein